MRKFSIEGGLMNRKKDLLKMFVIVVFITTMFSGCLTMEPVDHEERTIARASTAREWRLASGAFHFSSSDRNERVFYNENLSAILKRQRVSSNSESQYHIEFRYRLNRGELTLPNINTLILTIDGNVHTLRGNRPPTLYVEPTSLTLHFPVSTTIINQLLNCSNITIQFGDQRQYIIHERDRKISSNLGSAGAKTLDRLTIMGLKIFINNGL